MSATATSQTQANFRPNVYTLLDQRLAKNGKPLYPLAKEFALAITTNPTSYQELQQLVTGFIGLWSPDATKVVKHQTVACAEHLNLMDELAAANGGEITQDWEASLLRAIGNLFSKVRDWNVFMPTVLLPANDVTSQNAYSALAQRASTFKFQIHDDLKSWFDLHKTEILKDDYISDLRYLQLAHAFSGSWPTLPPNATRLQKLFADFLNEVAVAKNPSHAVVIQTALQGSFAQSFRKMVKKLREPVTLQEESVILSTDGSVL